MAETRASSNQRCHECGTLLVGAGTAAGLCSVCLVSSATTTARPARLPAGIRSPGNAGGGPLRFSEGLLHRTLQPIGAGEVSALWAMPAELMRQASRRLRVAAFGVGLAMAITIILINLVKA